jgi:DNA mismatch repair protein MSH6
MYENQHYGVRTVKAFVAVLRGFKLVHEVIEAMRKMVDAGCPSDLLKSVVLPSGAGGCAPSFIRQLSFFDTAFDHKQAISSGCITAKAGADENYDKACVREREAHSRLQDYLDQVKKELQCREIVYWGNKPTDRFQLEMPEAVASR